MVSDLADMETLAPQGFMESAMGMKEKIKWQ